MTIHLYFIPPSPHCSDVKNKHKPIDISEANDNSSVLMVSWTCRLFTKSGSGAIRSNLIFTSYRWALTIRRLGHCIDQKTWTLYWPADLDTVLTSRLGHCIDQKIWTLYWLADLDIVLTSRLGHCTDQQTWTLYWPADLDIVSTRKFGHCTD